MLSGVLLASSMPVTSFADVKNDVTKAEIMPIKEKEPTGSSEEPTSADMEKAILAVKSKIAIPVEFSEFNYYFSDASSYSDAYWRFTWTNPKNNSMIQINCDNDNHITYYNKYDYSDKLSGISKYLKKELKSKADEFIRQIAPELKQKYEFMDAEYDGIYNGNYVYKYERNENSVAFPDNTIQVSVNSISGEVTSAVINWLYDESVPSSSAKISKEAAAKLIKENMKMKLVYRSDYIGIYDKFGNRQTKAFLVYEPSQNYISIDAKSGKVYLERSEWITVNAGNTSARDGMAKEAADMDGGSVSLTEKEIAKIKELNGLISKEKAIDIVTSNKSLYLEDTLKSVNASLSKLDTANGGTSYVWYINMSDPREIDYNNKNEDYYRAYASASVDAKSGKILSFYSSVRNYYNEKNKKWEKVDIKYNKEEAQSILEKFLKSQNNKRFSNSILANSFDDYIAYYKEEEKPVYGGYGFTYNRTNEGIEYPYNSIYGSVDGVTGKIYSYGYNWDDNIEFESSQGVMTPDKAMEYYLGNKGFGLKYEINTINKFDTSYKSMDSYEAYKKALTVDYEIRLVYRPDVNPGFISPFTGEQLTYDGKVYKEVVPFSYTDISDSILYRNVFLLADMGLGFEGDSFLPDKAITVGELNKLLTDVGYGYYNQDDDASAEDTITKEKTAQLFITKLGLEKVSKLAGIYKTGFNDESSISSDYVGAVALSKALGLMTADANNNFNPKNEITRLEAVNLIMNFINVQKTGIY
jgi:hypothetical protein